jgi:hypothetical protein
MTVVNSILANLRTQLATIAKAVVALVVPLAITAGFELLDSLDAADLPQPWRLLITVIGSALSVYRVPNKTADPSRIAPVM